MKPLRLLVLCLAVLGGRAARADDAPRIEFLDVEAASDAVVDDANEPYFSRLQAMEIREKAGGGVAGDSLEAQRDALKQLYRDAVRAFTEREKQALAYYAEYYHVRVRDPYPRFARTPWRFVKVTEGVEGGLSHTRGSCIVLSPRDLANLVESREADRGDALRLGLLLHLQMLVVRRAHRERFDDFFREKWGLLRADTIERGAWLTRHQHLDPDQIDSSWVFPVAEEDETERWVLPCEFFAPGRGPMRRPTHVVRGAVELDRIEDGFAVRTTRGGRPEYEPLHDFQPLRDAFPGALGHPPNRMMADLFVKVVIWDLVLGRKPSDRPRLSRHRQEFAELLAD